MFGNNKELQPFKFDIVEVSDNMSNKDYHSRKEISSSFVKGVYKHSIGNALAPMINDDGKLSKALIIGDAFHEVMEIGHLNEERFIVKPEGMNLATKEGREWKDGAKGKQVLSKDEFDLIMGMKHSIYRNESWQKMLSSNHLVKQEEWSFFANGDCEHTNGLQFRVRPDVHFVNKRTGMIEYIFDYKTCNDIGKLVKWEFRDLAYDIQSVFYSDILGVDPTKFIFIAVEKKQPYSCRFIKMSKESVNNARMKMVAVFDKIKIWKEDPDNYKNLDTDLPEIIEI